MMRTHGHREGTITHWSVFGGNEEGQRGVGRLGRENMGRNPDIGDGGMEETNHIAMYVPMQQSCMFCTCTPKPKMQ